MNRPLLVVRNVSKHFPVQRGWFSAERRGVKPVSVLDDVSLEIVRGETLGLVGESGCGKSTLGKIILRLIEPSAGEIFFDQANLLDLSSSNLRRMRKRMQMIFQDSNAALDPRMRVEEILSEPLQIHRLHMPSPDRQKKILQLLDMCGLARSFLTRYPRELSGGQRQRLCIARALAVEPEFLICDEPLSSLDISIQAQILDLLRDLQKELRLTYLFISHDLRVVAQLATHVAVMYRGKIVETATVENFRLRPKHPYTRALRAAIPAMGHDASG